MERGVLLYGVSALRMPEAIVVREGHGPFGPARGLPAAAMAAGAPARRWARLVLAASSAAEDPRTLGEWGRAVGVSRSVLIESCARLDVPPRNARDLARMLRLVCRVDVPWNPDAALDVADRRTLRVLIERAGLAPGTPRPTPLCFLHTQQFVSPTNAGLMALQNLLRT